MTRHSRLTLVSAIALAVALVSNANAVSIATDSFESYSTGALNTANGGTGWGAAWSANSNVNVVAGGLNYANGHVSIIGGNQAVEIVYNTAEGSGITDGIISRALSASQSGTVYMSLLFSDTVNPDLGNDFAQFGFDTGTANPRASVMRRNGTFQARSTTAAGNSADSGIATNVGETSLVILKVEKNGSNYDEISLFLNPTSAMEPLTADAVSSVDSGLSSFSNFLARTAFHDLNDAFRIDAIQIGSTFADVVQVVPEPTTVVLLLTGGLAMGLRRRKSIV